LLAFKYFFLFLFLLPPNNSLFTSKTNPNFNFNFNFKQLQIPIPQFQTLAFVFWKWFYKTSFEDGCRNRIYMSTKHFYVRCQVSPLRYSRTQRQGWCFSHLSYLFSSNLCPCKPFLLFSISIKSLSVFVSIQIHAIVLFCFVKELKLDLKLMGNSVLISSLDLAINLP